MIYGLFQIIREFGMEQNIWYAFFSKKIIYLASLSDKLAYI